MLFLERLALGVVVAATLTFCGCATSTESAGSQNLTAHVGVFPPPPPGAPKPRVGVPPFEVTGGKTQGLERIAADIATTLLVNTQRFNVIERAQIDQLISEQNLEGIVKAGEVAPAGQVRGVDQLLLGKITNFRVKRESAKRGFGLGQIGLPFGGSIGAADFEKENSEIKVEVGIDLRLVDPASGEILAARSKDYTRTDAVSAFGVQILGMGASAEAEVELDDDNKGLVLRLATDACLREMLPSIDQHLKTLAPAAPPAAPPAASGGDTPPPAVAGFCGSCGNKLTPGSGFCGGCGAKL